MTLRKKITLLCSLVILSAIAVSDISVFYIYRKSVQTEALQAACLETEAINNKYEAYRTQLSQTLPDPMNLSASEIQYFFKISRDDMSIIMNKGVIIYNSTGIDVENIAENSVRNFRGYAYYEINYNGKPLLIVNVHSSYGDSLLHIYDLSEIRKKLKNIAIALIAVSIIITTAALFILRAIMASALRPMEALSAQARAISQGAYAERVAVIQRDEVGQLAENFNHMADAVQAHIHAVEESERRKTLFMGSLTHELKTPLTAISGYAQTLRVLQLSPDDRDKALNYIDSESRRLDRLSKKMMRLLQLEQETSFQFENIKVNNIIENAIIICNPIAEQNHIHIEKSDSTGFLYCDKDLIVDAIVNIIINAIRASKEGQTVEILSSNGIITIEDHGCGIPADEIDKITEPFYMIDKSRSRKNGGSGLGLAITAQILQLHNIDLTIESKIGKGTKMNLHFDDKSVNT